MKTYEAAELEVIRLQNEEIVIETTISQGADAGEQGGDQFTD